MSIYRFLMALCLLVVPFTLLRVNSAIADEYLYPVASLTKGNESYLFLLYQKSSDVLELLLFDPITKIISASLPSQCMPTGMVMCPDKSGFSFIDNGRLKVKLFNKRSPKSIDFYESLHDIELIQWINDFSFYFSAKQHKRLAIFQANICGDVYQLCGQENADCMYPQKVGEQLFYIERTLGTSPNYRIMFTPYRAVEENFASFNTPDHFDIRVQTILKQKEDGIQYKKVHVKEQNECILDCGKQPTIFLRMTADNEGFFVQYASTICSDDNSITLVYNQLKRSNDEWKSSPIFSFDIPLFLLMEDCGKGHSYRSENADRLCESLLPLLPCHVATDIYYVHYDSNKNAMNIFQYDTLTSMITQKTDACFDHYCFAPIVLNDKIYYGGALSYATTSEMVGDRFKVKENKADTLPEGMWVNNYGRVCCEVPFFNLT